LALKKNIKVKFECRILEGSTTLAINESKITRVLDNIITNAIKFSEAGSNVIISLEKVEKKLAIIIKDTGVGMSEEVIKHLFVKPGKSQRDGLNGEKSHGLGLSIVKQIMELHKGAIAIESKEGIGTNVTLTFSS
jgi:two-component system sensor histidine kinase VicK